MSDSEIKYPKGEMRFYEHCKTHWGLLWVERNKRPNEWTVSV